ncbi:unnamed protein product [Arabidopsis lyrata]|uniref:Predicted protein n=1 Tax=Arabidopsis lyrata subsp. lyrata TaxID=81972 RepID=D7M2G3_ARALL|nr:predicted protein [Arabidopsis lyrata subsp. lyrata]CAH8272053.1 unnamed protein product [Arabidopsis lyrata]
MATVERMNCLGPVNSKDLLTKTEVLPQPQNRQDGPTKVQQRSKISVHEKPIPTVSATVKSRVPRTCRVQGTEGLCHEIHLSNRFNALGSGAIKCS